MKLKFNTLLTSVLIAISLNAIAQTGTPTLIKYGSFVSVSPNGSAYQRDLATDANGNMYGVGYVKGLTTPPVVGTVTTSGDSIYQKTFGGGISDGYLYKMAADGKSVAWWTFLGGGGMDDIWGVEYAKEGANEFLYISGYSSANIAIPASKLISGASYKGGYEGFVSKINAQNGQMEWFNWIGSTADDGAFTIKVSENFIHLGGYASQNFPTTSNAYKKKLNNNFNWASDGFYARYDKNGVINYSTLVGFETGGININGGNPEGKKGVVGMEVLSDNEVFLCGSTKIDGGVTFINEMSPIIPIDGVKAISTYNGFVMRLNVATSISPFATLIRGTSSSTLTNAVDIKKFGTYLYVLGLAKGGVIGGLPLSAFQRTNKGGTDAYVMKIDLSNYSLNNASMYGGSSDEYVGNLNVCTLEPTFSGQTASSDLPVVDYLTTGALSSPTRYMDSYKGNSDYFFASFDDDFTELTFATYLGGSGIEHSYNADVFGKVGGQVLIGRDILFGASSHSRSDFPTTIGSWKNITDATVATSSGDLDFIVRFEKKGATCEVLTTVPPTLDLDLPGDSISGVSNNYKSTYLENPGTKVSIANAKSNGVSIVDADSPNLIGATITLTNAKANDVLEVVGTLPSGITSSVTSASGVITINLSNLASLADYQTAIQQIKFSNSSQNPDATVKRIVTVTVNDGFDISMVDTTFITVIPFNNTPTFDLDVNNSAGKTGLDYQTTYTENGTGVSIGDVDVAVNDADNATLSNGTVRLLSYVKGDTLKPISLPSSITATVVYNANNIVINLTGNGTLAQYQTAINAIQYKSTSDTLIADRTVEVIVSDGNSNSLPAYAYIKFAAKNDAPVLDLDVDNSTTTGTSSLKSYFEDLAGVQIVDNDVAITDVDNKNLKSGKIVLTNWFSGDTIKIVGTLPAGISASLTKVGLTLIINLTGTASKVDYISAFKQIQFASSSQNLVTTDRLINFTVNDDSTVSNTAIGTIKIQSKNDCPVVNLNTTTLSNYTTTYTENGAAVKIASASASIVDVDKTTQSWKAVVTLTNSQSLDVLTVPAVTTPFTATKASNVITITGTGTNAQLATLISNITFSSTSENPVTTQRLITVVITDDSLCAVSSSSIISVVAVNDAPFVINEYVTTMEDVKIINPILTITANDFDPDNDLILVTLLSNSKQGKTIINGSNYEYTPNPFYFGEDTAIFNLCDAKEACKPDTLFITVEPVSSAFLLDLDSADGGNDRGNRGIFTEGGSNVNISASQNSIFNPDNIDIENAKFIITNRKPGDTLIINGVLPVGVSPSIVSSAATLTLTITGNLDSTAYKNILKQIQYKNYRYDIDTSERFINVTVSNANGNSNIATATIKIVNVIDNDTITFSDSHLKSALINKGLDLNNDSKIQRKEIINVHKLNISNSSIADLGGIEAFVNLDTLIVSNNSLTSLNVKALINLKYLDASYNQLVGLNEQNFANQRLAVSNNTKLQTLLINNNQLTSLDVRNLASLKYLNASINNPLSVICVSEQHDLTYFTADLNVVYSTSCGLVTDAKDEVKSTEKVLIKVYNLFGQEVIHSENNSGFYIYQYSDGSTEKVLR